MSTPALCRACHRAVDDEAQYCDDCDPTPVVCEADAPPVVEPPPCGEDAATGWSQWRD